MRKLDNLHIEITLGVFLMLLSFILSFLMVINILKFDASLTIFFCLLMYMLSLVGLVLGLHGVFTMMTLRRKSVRYVSQVVCDVNPYLAVGGE
jgi:fatty-acid desaturase